MSYSTMVIAAGTVPRTLRDSAEFRGFREDMLPGLSDMDFGNCNHCSLVVRYQNPAIMTDSAPVSGSTSMQAMVLPRMMTTGNRAQSAGTITVLV